jgi:thioredoxin-related protein
MKHVDKVGFCRSRDIITQRVGHGMLVLLFAATLWITCRSITETGNGGSRINAPAKLAGEQWRINKMTLIVAVRPGCPWCAASAPFYRDIAASQSHNNFHIVFVSAVSINDTRAYLQTLDIPLADVKQASFSALGVRGTPTILLVDRKGIVRSVWNGKLSVEKEMTVFHAVHAVRVHVNVPLGLQTTAGTQ